MSSRYDTRTTVFSPEGRLYQVEYAMTGIGKASTAMGVITKDGIVFATERKRRNPMLDLDSLKSDKKLPDISADKLFKIDDHIGVAVAGLTADAHLLVDYMRRSAQSYQFQYDEPMPAEELCQNVCDVKQSYTQYGGVRPFGVSFLVAAFDKHHGYQLYETDPSGNYYAWNAQAIGANHEGAQGILKNNWKPDMTTREGILLCLKVLGKTLDSTALSMDRLDLAFLSRGNAKQGGGSIFHIYTAEEASPFLKEAEELRKKEEEEAESTRRSNRDE